MSKSNKKLHPNTDSDDITSKANCEICENTHVSYILNKVPIILINVGTAVSKVINVIIAVYGIYFIWTMLHFCASHLYIKFCVPFTFIGFVVSPFMTATPHCQGLRWIIFNGANMIHNMWMIIGSWVCSILLITPQAIAS